MNCWKGSLRLIDGTEIHDIRLDASSSKSGLPEGSSLQFLSHVDTSRIPLHLICGPRLEVWTTSIETESWFSNLLFNHPGTTSEPAWWHTASLESPLGILAAVQTPSSSNQPQPRMTEIIFYASRKEPESSTPPTPPQSSRHQQEAFAPDFQIHALPLSSDLLLPQTYEPSPPTSPTLISTDQSQGIFFPHPWSAPTLAQKRKQALETTFLAATELRRSQKRNPGTSVAAAAAGPNSLSFPSLPRLKQSEQQPNSLNNKRDERKTPSVPLLTRAKSRSPSIASLRRETTETRRTSGLQRVSTPSHDEDTDLIKRNKDAISKVVLAGMRVWGFSQSKKKKTTTTTITATQNNTFSSSTTNQDVTKTEEMDRDRINDEEYKLVYHNVYKAAVFAFRSCMGTVELSVLHNDKIRDTVDGLLAIFCKDPLDEGGFGSGAGGADMIEGPKGTVVRTPVAEEDKRLAIV